MALRDEITLLFDSTQLSDDVGWDRLPEAPSTSQELVTRVLALEVTVTSQREAILVALRRLADEIERAKQS